MLVALLAYVCGHLFDRRWLMALSGAGVLAGGMIWWNLRRFNHARRDGVFRVRREYAFEHIIKESGARSEESEWRAASV